MEGCSWLDGQWFWRCCVLLRGVRLNTSTQSNALLAVAHTRLCRPVTIRRYDYTNDVRCRAKMAIASNLNDDSGSTSSLGHLPFGYRWYLSSGSIRWGTMAQFDHMTHSIYAGWWLVLLMPVRRAHRTLITSRPSQQQRMQAMQDKLANKSVENWSGEAPNHDTYTHIDV